MSKVCGLAPMVAAVIGAACASAPTPLGAHSDVAIRWSVSQGLWGKEVFEVRRSGRAHYSFVPAGSGLGARSFDITVPRAALERIAVTARRVDFCAERSQRLGIPDEGRPTLALALPGVACAVTLWDGEWSERPNAREVARLVCALHQPPACGL